MIFLGRIGENQAANLLFSIKFAKRLARKLIHTVKIGLNLVYFEWVSLRINVKNHGITGVLGG